MPDKITKNTKTPTKTSISSGKSDDSDKKSVSTENRKARSHLRSPVNYATGNVLQDKNNTTLRKRAMSTPYNIV